MLHHTVTYLIDGQRTERRYGFESRARLTDSGLARLVARRYNDEKAPRSQVVSPRDVTILRVEVATLAR